MTAHSLHTAAFDPLARDYDASFTDTPVGRVLRSIVWSRAEALFEPGQRILELGCGTGEDAAEFARRGIHVVATDASAEMVDVAQRKASLRRCSDRVTFKHVAMEEAVHALGDTRFHGVFSNFGAINCVHDVPRLVADLARRLTSGAPLMWVVMGKHVPWEWIWYGLRGQGRKAVRRWRRKGVEWRGSTIRYPSPPELVGVLQPYFTMTKVSPLGCVLPPTYAARWLNRSPRTLAYLARLELRGQQHPALARISDHYILEARRTSDQYETTHRTPCHEGRVAEQKV